MPTLDYDYGHDEMSEWLDIGPTVEEESGWGVEETDFTTKLDYSSFTPEQVRQAQMIAKQISHEQKQYGESRHFDRNMRDRHKQAPVKHDNALGVHSAEDAIELLRRQKERQAAGAQHQQQGGHIQVPQPAAPQLHPGYNEVGGVSWLRLELEKCSNNIRLYGNPPPQHAARFLLRFGQELLQFLPNPPPDVKAQVLSAFAQVGWDVRIRQPLKGSHPPNGQQLTSLAFGLCCYFSHRNSIPLPPPEAGIVNVPQRPPPQAAPQGHGGKGGSYPQPRGGQHGGQQRQQQQQRRDGGKGGNRDSQGKGGGQYQGGRGGGGGNRDNRGRGKGGKQGGSYPTPKPRY